MKRVINSGKKSCFLLRDGVLHRGSEQRPQLSRGALWPAFIFVNRDCAVCRRRRWVWILNHETSETVFVSLREERKPFLSAHWFLDCFSIKYIKNKAASLLSSFLRCWSATNAAERQPASSTSCHSCDRKSIWLIRKLSPPWSFTDPASRAVECFVFCRQRQPVGHLCRYHPEGRVSVMDKLSKCAFLICDRTKMCFYDSFWFLLMIVV